MASLGKAPGERTAQLDVGSGGGLPGVVFAVCCPQVDVHCVDTVGKKAAFSQQAAVALKLPNLKGIHARVETLKGPYEIVSCRAFASLLDFTTWSRAAIADQRGLVCHEGQAPPRKKSMLWAKMCMCFTWNSCRCLGWMPSAALCGPNLPSDTH